MAILKRRHHHPLAVILFCCTTIVCAQKQAQEYQVKAVFLFNFAQFVEWPPSSFQASNALVIGVLGTDPFGSYLDETVRGEQVNGHPLKVVRYAKIEDVEECHILFIAYSEMPVLKHILANLKSKNILTVSDANGFTQQGGMIRFINEDRKTRIRINLPAVKETDLKISSKLLRLAEIVTPKNP